jgi:hypothetical protein
VSEGETKLGYQAHYVVDGGKARVILNVLVTPSEVSENRPMLDLLWRSTFRWRLWPDHVTGDAKYGTAQNVAAIEQANIRAFVALHRSGGKPTIFGREDFTYEPQEDVYICPAPENSYGPWVRRKTARTKKIARRRLLPTEPRHHPARGAS